MIQDVRDRLWAGIDVAWLHEPLPGAVEPWIEPGSLGHAPPGVLDFLQSVRELVRDALPMGVRLVLALDSDERLVWTMDHASTGAVIRRADPRWFDVRVQATSESLADILSGVQSPLDALAAREIVVEGDIGLFMRLCAAYGARLRRHGVQAPVR